MACLTSSQLSSKLWWYLSSISPRLDSELNWSAQWYLQETTNDMIFIRVWNIYIYKLMHNDSRKFYVQIFIYSLDITCLQQIVDTLLIFTWEVQCSPRVLQASAVYIPIEYNPRCLEQYQWKNNSQKLPTSLYIIDNSNKKRQEKDWEVKCKMNTHFSGVSIYRKHQRGGVYIIDNFPL